MILTGKAIKSAEMLIESAETLGIPKQELNEEEQYNLFAIMDTFERDHRYRVFMSLCSHVFSSAASRDLIKEFGEVVCDFMGNVDDLLNE